MIDPAPADALSIASPDSDWIASHSTEELASTGRLQCGETTLWERATCSLGQLQDHLAMVQDIRGNQKAGMGTITAKGYLPFGTQPAFTHISRYQDGILRVTTDFYLPRGTTIRQQASVGSIELGPDWKEYCLLLETDSTLKLTPWAPLAATNWDTPPLALLLRNAQGAILEIGTGGDVWRWQQGFAGEGNRGTFQLKQMDTTSWHYLRQVTLPDEPLAPAHLEYRFTWYAAWSLKPLPASCEGEAVQAEWRDDGKLLPASLNDLTENHCLDIDLGAAPWPENFCHTGKSTPCLTARGANKRLRSIVRQLQAHSNQSFAIRFTGLLPTTCQEGSHLGRHGALRHWDMSHILDVAQWIRHTLGPERQLFTSHHELALPSLANLFKPGIPEVTDSRIPEDYF